MFDYVEGVLGVRQGKLAAGFEHLIIEVFRGGVGGSNKVSNRI